MVRTEKCLRNVLFFFLAATAFETKSLVQTMLSNQGNREFMYTRDATFLTLQTHQNLVNFEINDLI